MPRPTPPPSGSVPWSTHRPDIQSFVGWVSASETHRTGWWVSLALTHPTAPARATIPSDRYDAPEAGSQAPGTRRRMGRMAGVSASEDETTTTTTTPSSWARELAALA